MRLTMSRWIRGREAMRPFLWPLRRWAGHGKGAVWITVGAGDACRVQSAESEAGAVQNAECGLSAEAEDGGSMGRVAVSTFLSIMSNSGSLVWFMFAFIYVFSCLPWRP